MMNILAFGGRRCSGTGREAHRSRNWLAGNRSRKPEAPRYNDEFKFKADWRIAQLAEQNPEKLYKAEYVGSGTFIISKPKRKKNKQRQAKLKNPNPGARK